MQGGDDRELRALPRVYLQKTFLTRVKNHLAHPDGHVTEFVKDDFSHAAVNKGVAKALVSSPYIVAHIIST